MENYYVKLSRQLARTAELYVLDTAETEALTALESMVTASPSQNISQAHRTLTNGLRESSMIMRRQDVVAGILIAALQALENVRYATIVRRPGKPTVVKAYIGR